MKKASTSPLRARVKSADRSARWREEHPDHIDTRVIDRMILQAVFHVLTDERSVSKSVASTLITAIVDAACEGLAERGHRGPAAMKSVGARMSVDTGTLDVSCSAHDEAVTMIWTESGGPPVKEPAATRGYGSKLMERSVIGPLRGSIDYNWAESGVVVTLKIAPGRLAH